MKKPLLLPPILVLLACEPQPVGTLPPISNLPPPVVTTGQGLADCEPMQLWSSPIQGYGIAPGRPTFSPNGGLVAWGNGIYFTGTTYFRRSNGDQVLSIEQDVADRDLGWQTGVRADGERIWIETLVGRSELFSIAQRGSAFAGDRVGLSPGGERLFMLVCPEDESIATLESWSIPEGVPASPIPLGDTCDGLWSEPSARVRGIDADRALIATRHGVHFVDVHTGAIKTAHLDSVSEQQLPTVVSFDADPSLEQLSIVTHDGVLHQASLDSMEEVGAPRSVPIIIVNRNVYAPTVFSSPVAWSNDGRLRVTLDADRALVLEEPTGAVHFRIAPKPGTPEWTGDLADEPVLAAAFNADSTLLAVGFEHNFALYGCAPLSVDIQPDAIPVRLDGPPTVALGVTAELVATDLRGIDVHGHQFFVDGVATGQSTDQRTFIYTPETPGEHVIEVLIDDGVLQGRGRRTVTVP